MIQIDNSSSFTAPLTLSQTVSASTATITGLPARTLWWRVRGVNAGRRQRSLLGLAAVHRAGRRLAGPLPAPSLLAPAADARFRSGQTILFDWSDVAGAATYTIQIDDSSSFSSPLVLQTVGASQLATSSCPGGDVVARARERPVGTGGPMVGGAPLRGQELSAYRRPSAREDDSFPKRSESCSDQP